MTKAELMALINDVGADKLLSIVFDNGYTIVFPDASNVFDPTDIVTIGGTEFIKRYTKVGNRSLTATTGIKVVTYHPLGHIQAVQFLDNVVDKKNIDKSTLSNTSFGG
jgi:hypothetical protein